MVEVLQFGGGKDSLACLFMLREKWPTLIVAWMNTGAAFPETIAQMECIRALVPNFVEIKADVLADIQEHGWPADVVPVRNTNWGKATTGEQGIRMRSWWHCCTRNFWVPMHAKMLELGATRVYRGQRNSEDYKSPIRSGAVLDGIEYVFPIEGWSERDVAKYLSANDVPVPDHYAYTAKSLDCWCCTAYLDAKVDQMRYLRSHHAERHAQVMPVMQRMHSAIDSAVRPLAAAADPYTYE